jgi:hypothetical protein
MADNVLVTTAEDGDVSSIPTGTTFRTDDVGGVQYQVVKLDIGGDGVSSPVTDLATGAKQDTANTALAAIEAAVEGTLTVGSHAVTNAGTFAVQESGGALTALQLIDDTVYTDGTGTPSKAIGIAGTDGTNPQIIKTDSSGELQIDVLSSVLPSGASTSAKQDTIVTTLEDLGTDADAADIVYLAKLDDIITATEATQAAVQTIDNAISGSEMQVDVVAALPAGTNNIGDVDVASIAAGDNNIGNVDVVTLPSIPAGTNNIGDVDVLTLPALPAGTNNIGDVDVLTLPALAAGTNTIGGVNVKPATTGGLTTYHLVSAATTNLTVVKASAGQLFGWYIYNSNASARKLAFHNSASAPTAGASIFFSLVIPATSGANVELTNGIAFSTGIAISTVTGLADSDTTAVALNDLIINLFYA